MNHVNLNTASDAVRQVILSFPANGTVFELDGRPIACLVPPPTRPGDSEEWTSKKNARRFYLIDKKAGGTISDAEAIELEDLQEHLRRYRREVTPLPLAETRRMLEELERKAAQAKP